MPPASTSLRDYVDQSETISKLVQLGNETTFELLLRTVWIKLTLQTFWSTMIYAMLWKGWQIPFFGGYTFFKQSSSYCRCTAVEAWREAKRRLHAAAAQLQHRCCPEVAVSQRHWGGGLSLWLYHFTQPLHSHREFGKSTCQVRWRDGNNWCLFYICQNYKYSVSWDKSLKPL